MNYLYLQLRNLEELLEKDEDEDVERDDKEDLMRKQRQRKPS